MSYTASESAEGKPSSAPKTEILIHDAEYGKRQNKLPLHSLFAPLFHNVVAIVPGEYHNVIGLLFKNYLVVDDRNAGAG